MIERVSRNIIVLTYSKSMERIMFNVRMNVQRTNAFLIFRIISHARYIMGNNCKQKYRMSGWTLIGFNVFVPPHVLLTT